MNVMRSNIDVLLSNITNAKIDVDELIRNLVCVRHTFRHGKARLGSAWLGLGEVGAAWGGSARFEAIVRVAQVFESSYSATLIKFKNDTANLDVLPSNIVDVSHNDIHELREKKSIDALGSNIRKRQRSMEELDDELVVKVTV